MKSLSLPLPLPLLHISSPKSTTCSQKPRIPYPKKTQLGFEKHSPSSSSSSSSSSSCTLISVTYGQFIQKSLPFASSVALLLSAAYPASAGILSGSTGIESVPGPKLPQVDFRFNDSCYYNGFLTSMNMGTSIPYFLAEENQNKYAENDARFKSSPLLKKLLEQSKLNKQKNQQETQDKYCIHGAEWGIEDCSAEGMSPKDKENFIAMLKQKAGYKE